nr:2-isopropylmalate synthase [uncultured bacterium]
MDTTLRDGEQTEGVSIMAEEKMAIARLLLEAVKVDRIEIANARVSQGEFATVKQICDWARKEDLIDRIEILGFVDHTASVDWAASTGCRVINLLTKGSRKHCETQLRKTLPEHLKDIRRTLDYGASKGVGFNVYLEDWSGGMLHSPDYVFEMLDAILNLSFKRIMLPDTLGILEPGQVRDFVGQVVARYPGVGFDFHGHNDYGMATVNSLEAVRAGCRAVHTTINGLGERAGNAALDEVVVAMNDFTPFRCRVDEKKLQEASRLTEVFTGKQIAWNKPITGENVFTQTAGIHADGDKKGELYSSRITPVRFKRDRTYALGKLMGRASLEFNLKKLNIELSDEQKKAVLNKIVELADNKKVITSEDLPFIISDVLGTPEERLFEVKDFAIVSNRGLRPLASVLVRYKEHEFQAVASGDGGYDAFMKALRSLEGQLGFKIPTLLDYAVRIPPGGKTDALVETTIAWDGGMKTRAVNSDQLVAAIMATSHAINLVAVHSGKAKSVKVKS